FWVYMYLSPFLPE
ncbi:hypothetical protein VC87395_001860B, partial [Vibrio paracholerae 87395]